MKVKIFDESHEKDLEIAINKFLSENDIDIVFDGDDEHHVFTGVLKDVPVKHYKTDLVCKSYTKITVSGEQFTVYGEAVIGNIYDTAKKLLETDPGNEDLLKIISDYGKDIGLPGDDLFE